MATSVAPVRIVRVEPQDVTAMSRGLVQPNGDEIFQLSDTGHQIISFCILLVDIFELPESASKAQVIATLIKGLECALGDHPELTGTMHFDNEAKRIVIKKPRAASAALHIKDATPTAGSSHVPSYAWLHKHDYPVHRLEIEQLVPAEAASMPMIIAQDLDTPGPAVAAFQATYIEGGIIIASAISHQVCDGLGVDAFFTTWAAYSKAATTGEPAKLDGDVPPHTLFSAATKPAPEEWENLKGKYPAMKYNTAPPPPPPADFVPPVVKTRVFHFPRSKLEKLKAVCSVGLPSVEGIDFISSYDAISALWWRAMLRTKRPLMNLKDEDPTCAMHAVNMRKRAGGAPISARYIGSSVALPRSETVTISQALGPRETALPLLARIVRGVTRQVTPEYIKGQMDWAAGAPDLRYNELDMPWVGARDFTGFGWHDMKPYSMHDFGFGLPTGFRWPQMAFDTFFFMLPSRAGVKGARPDEGIEVTFGVEESCFPRLECDEELLAYCEQRGLGS
ncbi:transferase family-domain-containing protein [Xylariaceae sp. FL0016]|nr:transferase family-domain-containing protein [Xylariaceae sp. FL0016]